VDGAGPPAHLQHLDRHPQPITVGVGTYQR
jgi:hypothetical protein